MEPNPVDMDTVTSPFIIAIAILAIGGSLFLWTWMASRLTRHTSLLAACPRRNVPWRGLHVAVAFFLYLVIPFLSVFFLKWRFQIPLHEPLPEDNLDVLVWTLAAVSALTLVSASLVVTFLKIDLAATSSDLGWPRRSAAHDVMLGLLAFLAIGPPVFVLQSILMSAYDRMFDDSGLHPLIKLVQENPRPDVIALTAISAVLVAPLVEEFLFRVVLQGWLEKVSLRTRQLATHDVSASSVVTAENAANDQPEQNPYASPADLPTGAAADSSSQAIVPPLLPGPILFSSVLFASFHIGQGPAPIPLFLLALVLGYLYQKTHRLLPCVTLHMALNGASMAVLWLSVN